MENTFTWLLLLIPVLPLVAALFSISNSVKTAQRAAIVATGSALLVALVGTALLVVYGPGQWRWSPLGADSPLALTLRLDAVAMTMAVLVSFVGLTVLRFSANYLAGDPHQKRFFAWLGATLGSVLLMVLSGNLLILWLAWVATSLFLHRLLIFYPHRTSALFAARKKFVFSRLGDTCLLIAICLIYTAFGTLEMDRLFAAVAGEPAEDLTLVAFLLVACAMLKSAQFPFHGWLPDTMETPTPVSALMHAGVINAGGFLLIRLSPLFSSENVAMHFLALVGTLTAAFGAVVMLAQPSVKRALAYSTIAQMGFMLLQCGLGAFGLALMHIVAHSLYKAHAFLRSGSTIGAVPRAAVPLRLPHLVFGLCIGAAATLGAMMLAKPMLTHSAPPVLAVVTALALAYGTARMASIHPGTLRLMLACLGALLVAGLVFALHGFSGYVYQDLPVTPHSMMLSYLVGAVFVGLFLIQSFVWRANRSPFGRRFYVHALNGFYVGTFGNRLLQNLWPPHPITSAYDSTKPPIPIGAISSEEKPV